MTPEQFRAWLHSKDYISRPIAMNNKREEMKPIYIASCSFGKDSIATILLALENNEPLDRVVFAVVMFDNKRGISGEIPEHIEWVRSTI